MDIPIEFVTGQIVGIIISSFIYYKFFKKWN